MVFVVLNFIQAKRIRVILLSSVAHLNVPKLFQFILYILYIIEPGMSGKCNYRLLLVA